MSDWPRHHRRATLRLSMTLVIAAALPLAFTGASGAAGSSVTATINVAIKSVTLSTDALTYGNCQGGYSTLSKLGFPNGVCTSGDLTVTNGDVPSAIVVAGSSAAPADGGKQWSLCGATPLCNPRRPTAGPGIDQFSERLATLVLSTAAACDPYFSFGRGCPMTGPGARQTESLMLVGPSASTDQSGSFTTRITWTAT